MSEDNNNGLTAGAVITLCLAMLVASNGIMFWGLNNLKEQINEKANDRYTGSQAQSDKHVIEAHMEALEWRIKQLEDYVREHRSAVERSMASDT